MLKPLVWKKPTREREQWLAKNQSSLFRIDRLDAESFVVSEVTKGYKILGVRADLSCAKKLVKRILIDRLQKLQR
jgi:hypothetical protein